MMYGVRLGRGGKEIEISRALPGGGGGSSPFHPISPPRSTLTSAPRPPPSRPPSLCGYGMCVCGRSMLRVQAVELSS